FLCNLLDAFPPAPGYPQNKRIVSLGSSAKYVMYALCDQLLFGQIDDMLAYWDLPQREGARTPADTIAEYCQFSGCPEVYLTRSYVRRLGGEAGWTLAESWRAYARHFCVIDAQMLDLFWYKYDTLREYRFQRYDGVFADKRLTFLEWFNIYQGLANKQPYEWVCRAKL